MINPYVIILSTFGIAGAIVTLWGLLIIRKARKTLGWPSVEGEIKESSPASNTDDLMPNIRFHYQVDDQPYTRTLELPGSVSPSQELTRRYLEKYPAGTKIRVYYDPQHPERATLEPGVGSDWMVFAMGLMATVFSIGALFFSN